MATKSTSTTETVVISIHDGFRCCAGERISCSFATTASLAVHRPSEPPDSTDNVRVFAPSRSECNPNPHRSHSSYASIQERAAVWRLDDLASGSAARDNDGRRQLLLF